MGDAAARVVLWAVLQLYGLKTEQKDLWVVLHCSFVGCTHTYQFCGLHCSFMGCVAALWVALQLYGLYYNCMGALQLFGLETPGQEETKICLSVIQLHCSFVGCAAALWDVLKLWGMYWSFMGCTAATPAVVWGVLLLCCFCSLLNVGQSATHWVVLQLTEFYIPTRYICNSITQCQRWALKLVEFCMWGSIRFQ